MARQRSGTARTNRPSSSKSSSRSSSRRSSLRKQRLSNKNDVAAAAVDQDSLPVITPAPAATRPLRKILFLGESGAGKSFAAKQLLSLDGGRAVKIVNDNTNAILPPNYERISWQDSLKVRDCNLYFEDLITCTKQELEILLKIANFNTHHHNLFTVIFIAHDSQSQGIGPLLKHLSHVCLMTSNHSAGDTLSSMLVKFKVSKGDRDAKVAAFLADVGKEAFSYWVFDVRLNIFSKQPGSLTSDLPLQPSNPGSSQQSTALTREALIAPYRKTAENYLPMLTEEPEKCLSLFDFIFLKTPVNSIHPSTLDFTLRDARTKKLVVVSLFDYLLLLTSATAVPTKPLLDLHFYLARFSTLPLCFVANRHRKFTAAVAAAASAAASTAASVASRR